MNLQKHAYTIDTFGEYSADGMEFSANSYTKVTLNNQNTSKQNLTSSDKELLRQNTNELIEDVKKGNSGDGVASPLTKHVKNDYKTLIENNPNLKQKLENEKRIALTLYNVDIKDIHSQLDYVDPPLTKEAKDRIFSSLKKAKEYDGENQWERIYENLVTDGVLEKTANDIKDYPFLPVEAALGTYETIQTAMEDGSLIDDIEDGSLIVTLVEKIALRKVEKLLGAAGDKVVKYGGKFYTRVKGKIRKIEVKNAKTASSGISIDPNKNLDVAEDLTPKPDSHIVKVDPGLPASKNIVLGRQQTLKSMSKKTDGNSYYAWQKEGLSSANPMSHKEFVSAFNEATANAKNINFSPL